jgi:redox-sensitive bicupin YhaK (pirin superfamily)
MKVVIDKASSRGFFDHGWLQTYHTFSFAGYYNPRRMQFGALRVLNDDTVAPAEGFGTHPHKNMEVVSIPLKGELKHGDSEENMDVIYPGDIQVMSTGRGIYHSEFNNSSKKNVEFLQIWVFPKENETKPEYHNYDIRGVLKKNQLGFFISPDGDAPAKILQDAWFSMGTFDGGKEIFYNMHKDNTGVYIFIIEGEIEVDGNILTRRDGIGVYETSSVPIKIKEESTILLIEVPMI